MLPVHTTRIFVVMARSYPRRPRREVSRWLSRHVAADLPVGEARNDLFRSDLTKVLGVPVGIECGSINVLLGNNEMMIIVQTARNDVGDVSFFSARGLSKLFQQLRDLVRLAVASVIMGNYLKHVNLSLQAIYGPQILVLT